MIPKGTKGDKGENGTSISITTIDTDNDGNKVVHFSDGKTLTVPKGQDGTSIGIKTITTSTTGDKVVTFTDGKSITIPKGDRGENGQKVKTVNLLRLQVQQQMALVTQLSTLVMVVMLLYQKVKTVKMVHQLQ